MTFARKLLFMLVAVLVIPVLFFSTLELGLRLVGFGKSFDYFEKIKIDGRTYYQDNLVFLEQFYPASLQLTALDNTFLARNTDELVRVFVLGGSAARGFPNPDHAFARQLEVILKQALPSKEVEIINTAMTSINSHVVYETAKSIPNKSADFAIILMGNNEVIGPYGPANFDHNYFANTDSIRLIQAVKRSRIGQAASYLVGMFADSNGRNELIWDGMQMFTENTVPKNDPRLETVYEHYKNNLEDMIDILQDKGAQVVLSTVPVNLHDSAPFASKHKANLSGDELAQWEKIVQEANVSFEKEEWSNAIAGYLRALEIDAEYADTHYRMAVAYEKIGNYGKAYDYFSSARDHDALRFRTDSKINEIVRDVAERLGGSDLSFIDNDVVFDRESQPGSPGWNLFLEHVHFDFSGNYLLANGFANKILDALGESDQRNILSEADVAEYISYPSQSTVEAMNRLLGMVKLPPFTGQSNFSGLLDFAEGKLEWAESSIGSLQDQISRKQELIEKDVGDWRISFELAKLYDQAGNKYLAYKQLQRVFEEHTHHLDAYIMMARMLHNDSRFSEEIPYLERALKYSRGDQFFIAKLKVWLGVAYYKAGNRDRGFDALHDVADGYREHVMKVLQAYQALIEFSVESGQTEDVADYLDEVQGYAEYVVSTGKDKDHPKMYTQMAKIMRLAGEESKAREWLGF